MQPRPDQVLTLVQSAAVQISTIRQSEFTSLYHVLQLIPTQQMLRQKFPIFAKVSSNVILNNLLISFASLSVFAVPATAEVQMKGGCDGFSREHGNTDTLTHRHAHLHDTIELGTFLFACPAFLDICYRSCVYFSACGFFSSLRDARRHAMQRPFTVSLARAIPDRPSAFPSILLWRRLLSRGHIPSRTRHGTQSMYINEIRVSALKRLAFILCSTD